MVSLARFLNICMAFAMLISVCPCGSAFAAENGFQSDAPMRADMVAECHETPDPGIASTDDNCCGEPVTVLTKAFNGPDLPALMPEAMAAQFSLTGLSGKSELPNYRDKQPPPPKSPLILGDYLLI